MGCTIERGNPLFAVTHVTSATDLLCATQKIHDNWVASFRIWSRRGCHQFCGRPQTCRNQSNVQNSRKPLHVTQKIGDQNPSLGMICPGEPHQVSPNAPKFEDRSQEETEWLEQRAREAAEKLGVRLDPADLA